MVKKAMAVSMLTVLAFIFSGVNVAYGDARIVLVPHRTVAEFRLFHLNGEEIPRNGIIEIMPGNTLDVRVYPTGFYRGEMSFSPSPGAPVPAITTTVGIATPIQAVGRVSLHYSSRATHIWEWGWLFDSDWPLNDGWREVQVPLPGEGLLTISAPRVPNDPVMLLSPVSVQLSSVVLGGPPILSTPFPLRVKITNAGNARDDGNSGGTCNVAGFGFLALLLLPPVFLWKKRK